MPKILNIETATDICSVAISQEEEIISSKSNDKGFSHASTLTILIQECLKDCNITLAELDAVALTPESNIPIFTKQLQQFLQ